MKNSLKFRIKALQHFGIFSSVYEALNKFKINYKCNFKNLRILFYNTSFIIYSSNTYHVLSFFILVKDIQFIFLIEVTSSL
jgi:hypothetical protein